MKRVGILHGRERSFPQAFCERVNAKNAGVLAEPIGIEALRFDMDRPYDVIVDRLSHDVPFYQIFLKQCAMLGTRIINNPFWRIADDKYFGTCLVSKLGIAVPRTLLLPQKDYIADISPESLTNLRLVDWEAAARYVGFPCFLKPASGGGWKGVSKCKDLGELMKNYEASGQAPMMLQEGIQWQSYARLLCIGKEEVMIAPWNPDLPHHQRYTGANFTYGPELEWKMIEQGKLLNRALGYDMNTVEFAVRDGIPYAIDFTNTAPDFDRASLSPTHFEWVVERMADLAIRRAYEPELGHVQTDWKQHLR